MFFEKHAVFQEDLWTEKQFYGELISIGLLPKALSVKIFGLIMFRDSVGAFPEFPLCVHFLSSHWVFVCSPVFTAKYCDILTHLFSKPSPTHQSSAVTLAFSPNVNLNRLSTEGYCSSSQKRRQIFRYWGAAYWLVCCHVHFFQSGLVMVVVTCGGYYTCLA